MKYAVHILALTVALSFGGVVRADDSVVGIAPVSPETVAPEGQAAPEKIKSTTIAGITVLDPGALLPWNRSFTLRDDAAQLATSVLPPHSNGVDIPAGSKWGVTVNLDANDRTYEYQDRVSAGAYFDISPRIRLGGSLSFTAPGEFRTSPVNKTALPVAPGEDDPAVRIESSIKF